jgi:hypothetical protein
MSITHPGIAPRTTTVPTGAGRAQPYAAAARTTDPAPRRRRWRLSRRLGGVEHRRRQATWLPTVPVDSSDAVTLQLVLGSLHTRVR